MPSPVQSRLPWPTIFQFIFSALAMLGSWSLAAAILAASAFTRFGADAAGANSTANMLQAAGLGLAGVLLVPSTLFSFLRILGRPAGAWSQAPVWGRLPWILLPAWPLALLAGDWAARQPDLAWLLLPPLYLLGVGLPVWWFVAVGKRGLSAGSPQRTWGLLAAGLVMGPGLILVIEVVGVLIAGVAAVIVIGMNPAWQAEAMRLSQRLINSQGDLEAIQRILRPFLAQPGILFLGLASIAGVVPLIEEAFKPVGLWFLAGSRLTPAEGFTGGLISGAGFALFESLSMSSSLTADLWASGTFARAGTDLVHILATGLMGWALASAWTERRYLRLGVTFGVAMLIHGLWNAISVTTGILPLAPNVVPGLPDWAERASLAPLALGVLVIAMFAILLRANRLLRKETLPPAGSGPQGEAQPSL